jgi:hypothetical protein
MIQVKAGQLYDNIGNIAGAIDCFRDITSAREPVNALKTANELEIRVHKRTSELTVANKAL